MIFPTQIGLLTLEELAAFHFSTFQPLPHDVAVVEQIRQRPDVEGHGVAAVKEGRCLGFLVISEDIPETGLVHMFPSDELRRDHGLTLARILGAVCRSLQQFKYFEAEIDVESPVNKQFAEWLGFQPHCVRNGTTIYRRAA